MTKPDQPIIAEAPITTLQFGYWGRLSRYVAEAIVGDHALLAVYVLCLTRARFGPIARLAPNGRILQYGQAPVGREQLALLAGLSVYTVRKAETDLAKLGLVSFESTTHGTIATIHGLGDAHDEAYQGSPADYQPTTNDALTTDHQRSSRRSRRRQPSATIEKKISVPTLREETESMTRETTSSLPSRQKKKAPTRTPGTRALRQFESHYVRAFGAAYVGATSDRATLDHLIEQHGEPKVRARISIFFECRSRNQAYSVTELEIAFASLSEIREA